ncbi:MAG: hypothetical protein IJ782_06570, partial [Prevotella sp.]|nr:hypothetical protein [Prevotella sp.]
MNKSSMHGNEALFPPNYFAKTKKLRIFANRKDFTPYARNSNDIQERRIYPPLKSLYPERYKQLRLY